jgi:hypothetical protein
MPNGSDPTCVPARYVSSPDVAWTVEARGIRVIHEASGRVLELAYPAAAVWDLVQRGYSADRIAGMLAAIAKVGRATAEGLYRENVEAWVRNGWLVAR